MNIVSFLGKFFGRDSEADASKSVAKQRLRLVLVHDRLDVSETIMNSLREDLISTIGKYMEIDNCLLYTSWIASINEQPRVMISPEAI